MMKEAAGPDRVDLWYVTLDGFTAEDQAICLRLLSEAERQRHDAFKSGDARLQHLAARGLVRTTLSRYRDVPPECWRFGATRQGRPFIDPDHGVAGLHFNLSHTHGLVVCAIAAIDEIGVDVERRDRDVGLDELAPGVLAPAELDRFLKLPLEARPKFFFTLWTLKEAYVKARGMGLALPMKDIRLDFPSSSPSVSFSGEIDDCAARWKFRSFRPTGPHIVGVAAAPPTGQLEVNLRHAGVVNLPGRD